MAELSRQATKELHSMLDAAYHDALDEISVEQRLPAEMRWAVILGRIRALVSAWYPEKR